MKTMCKILQNVCPLQVPSTHKKVERVFVHRISQGISHATLNPSRGRAQINTWQTVAPRRASRAVFLSAAATDAIKVPIPGESLRPTSVRAPSRGFAFLHLPPPFLRCRNSSRFRRRTRPARSALCLSNPAAIRWRAPAAGCRPGWTRPSGCPPALRTSRRPPAAPRR